MKAKKGIRNLSVGEAMTKEVVTVNRETSLADLRALFEKYDFNAFPVVEDHKLVGVVTKLDLMKTFTMGMTYSRSKYWDLLAERVEDVMREAVVFLQKNDSLEKAVEYMVEFRLRSLPVVDGGDLVGIISRSDVMKHLLAE